MEEEWLIVGCGYVGTRLARKLLSQGHRVSATRQSEEACRALRASVPGLAVVRYRLGDQAMAVPKAGKVLITVPPGALSPAPESAFAGRLPAALRLIYLSTTGVYADAGGAEVRDDFPLEPGSDRGALRLAVETALQAVHADHLCLRVPGIYGPTRGVHARMLANTYRIIGDGDSVISRIHVDDLVSAIESVARAPTLLHRSMLVGDDEPCSSLEHALGVAARLGLPPPPHVDAKNVSEEVRAMLSAGRRVVPERLKGLGWSPLYPSWREGLEQILAEEA